MWSRGESEFSHPGLHGESEKALEGSDVLYGVGTVKNGEWPFSRTLLAVLNSEVLTPWRLACIIYDIVLSEFFPASWGVGSVSLVWVAFHSGETRVLLFCSAVTGAPSSFSYFSWIVRLLYSLTSTVGMSLTTKLLLSDLHLSTFLLFHTARVISESPSRCYVSSFSPQPEAVCRPAFRITLQLQCSNSKCMYCASLVRGWRQTWQASAHVSSSIYDSFNLSPFSPETKPNV